MLFTGEIKGTDKIKDLHFLVKANTAVKDAGKAERKAITEKKTMTGKEKKPSIHERLEINKRIIQEKQGKDKPYIVLLL